MSQNNYNIMIVQKLLSGENHIRGLAKELRTNQTTISRKIMDLYAINAVDYRMEGKNKVYSMKNTLEARQLACIAEMYKVLDLLRRYPRLRTIIEKIRQNKRIDLAVLFGSYAKVLATEESDIDLFIETDDRRIKENMELIDSKLNVKIGSYDRKNILFKEIDKNHVILKGTEEYYAGAPFFG